MPEPRLGLRENLGQFALLVVVNAFVGAMVGMERAILSPIAEDVFHLAAKTAVLSFIVVFGVTKALTNYLAGRLADRFGRKHLLVGGWLVAAPVPFLLMWAPSWPWVLAANALLGVSQGLTWSTTVIMKIDIAGPRNRGLAMGVNEFAGYLALAGSALATGYIAAHFGLRPEPFYLGVGFVALGLGLSALAVRETKGHAAAEGKLAGELPPEGVPTQREVFWRTTLLDRDLSSVSQAGLVNNLNDGMAWGLFPLVFTAARMNLEQVGWLAALYPATWGVAQLFTGAWSDRVGRKWLIASGMWVQAIGIVCIALAAGFPGFALGAVLLGLGTAMVYPTLLAAIGDVAHPAWRASSVGVYRLWRDSGYAIGALLAGITADVLGVTAAIWLVAGLTFVSGLIVAARMTETLRRAPGSGAEPGFDSAGTSGIKGARDQGRFVMGTAAFVYGVVSYLVFLISFLYAIGFVGNLMVPKAIDTGPAGPLTEALVVNVLLLGLFALQHSVMARRGFKRWWTRFVPQTLERSTYVLISSLLLILLFWKWQPILGSVWRVENPVGIAVLNIFFWLGWAVVLYSTFAIDHFDLFGLRQVWSRLRGVAYVPLPFEQPWAYSIVRHPLLLGFLIAFWATPTMTRGHLLFSLATTGYMLVGIFLEERDLIASHGEAYVRYRREVRMLVPLPRRRAG